MKDDDFLLPDPQDNEFGLVLNPKWPEVLRIMNNPKTTLKEKIEELGDSGLMEDVDGEN